LPYGQSNYEIYRSLKSDIGFTNDLCVSLGIRTNHALNRSAPPPTADHPELSASESRRIRRVCFHISDSASFVIRVGYKTGTAVAVKLESPIPLWLERLSFSNRSLLPVAITRIVSFKEAQCRQKANTWSCVRDD